MSGDDRYGSDSGKRVIKTTKERRKDENEVEWCDLELRRTSDCEFEAYIQERKE
jgi:hypothetical protein